MFQINILVSLFASLIFFARVGREVPGFNNALPCMEPTKKQQKLYLKVSETRFSCPPQRDKLLTE